MRYLIKDIENDRVIIVFNNSSNELEYTIYEAKDGGIDGVIEEDIQEALELLLLHLDIPDAEVQEIKD